MSAFFRYRLTLLILPIGLVAAVILAHNLPSEMGSARFFVKLLAVPAYLGFRFIGAPSGTPGEQSLFNLADLFMLGSLMAGVTIFSLSTGFLSSTETNLLGGMSLACFALGLWQWSHILKLRRAELSFRQ